MAAMTQIRSTNTTAEILRELGARLRAYRLQQNLSHDDVASQAGLGRATVVRAEAGVNPTLETIVKILRALGRLDALDAFLPEPLVSPLQLAALRGQVRQRAGKPRARRRARASRRQRTAGQSHPASGQRSAGETNAPAHGPTPSSTRKRHG